MDERAWYFSAGDAVPEWLQEVEEGNCTLTFGVNVVVTSKCGGYEVRPQLLIDNPGPLMVVQGNDHREMLKIRGQGAGVNFIGYSRPPDKTAEARIAQLEQLLTLARPYIESYDTREHNNEQNIILTEIDNALLMHSRCK